MLPTYKRFNDHARLFLERMHETFPQESKIVTYRFKFEALSKIDPRKPVELFMDSMIPYGEQIFSKNENFFKQSEYVNKAESISGQMGLIKYWETMHPTTKQSIWEFMQGLYILGMGALGKQTELEQLILKTNFQA